MTNQTLSDLLVLALLFVGNSRFLFVHHSKKDTLSITPFVGFFVAIINAFVFNFTVENLIVLVFAFWTSFWNVRSVFRMLSDVILDREEFNVNNICRVNIFFTV